MHFYVDLSHHISINYLVCLFNRACSIVRQKELLKLSQKHQLVSRNLKFKSGKSVEDLEILEDRP